MIDWLFPPDTIGVGDLIITPTIAITILLALLARPRREPRITPRALRHINQQLDAEKRATRTSHDCR